MASAGLGLGELVDVLLPEVGDDGPQRGGLVGVDLVGAEHLAVGEEQQPLDLDVHAGPVERGFGEVLAEPFNALAVARVEGAQHLGREGAHCAPWDVDDPARAVRVDRTTGSIWRRSSWHALVIMSRTWSKS